MTELKISHLKDYHKGNLGENRYSKQDLEDLVESVKINGIIQPLVVRPLNENDEYEIILGHHRRDAALLAGLNTVPCLINDDWMMIQQNCYLWIQICNMDSKNETI